MHTDPPKPHWVFVGTEQTPVELQHPWQFEGPHGADIGVVPQENTKANVSAIAIFFMSMIITYIDWSFRFIAERGVSDVLVHRTDCKEFRAFLS
jgi:hypothetical protein